MVNDKTAFRVLLVVMAMAAFVAFFAFVYPGDVWGVETPVHANWGYTLDSVYFVHIQDSVRTDSSTKITDVTEWPDTIFDLTLGKRHSIRFYYWAYGFDSGVWAFEFDYYDYNEANCVGGGTYVAGLWVWDTANDVGISRADITIKVDSAQGATYKWSPGGVNGYVEFGLPNGDYVAVSGKPGYSIPNHPFTIASAAYSDTIKGYMIQTPAPPGGSVPTTNVSVFYFRDGTAVKGARLFARNLSVATDTVNDVIIGPVQVSDYTDGDGHAYVPIPRSYIYHDSLKALYDISLYHGSKLIKQWQDYWVPDQDTVRLVVEE